MIPVTKPFLPPQTEYVKYVTDIFQRNWLTNNGPLVNELEAKLSTYLGVKNMAYLGNGTIAIQIAIKAADVTGEVITTPFSYVATTSSIVWEKCDPVFVDIDELTLNIDPTKIEDAVTNRTTAILATHCFGNVCDIDAIEAIAKKHHLKVIYDAAHCFGTKYKGESAYIYGDIVTTSFHATKLFHTTEGGAIFTNDDDLMTRIQYMRNFGHNGPETFAELGINGKNSEFHAGMGLAVLPHIEEILRKRREQSLYYDKMLSEQPLLRPKVTERCEYNYAYYPIIFESEEQLLKSKQHLEDKRVFPRRYFYPSLSSLPYLEKQSTPIADMMASRVLCLPLYNDLTKEDQRIVIRSLKKSLKAI